MQEICIYKIRLINYIISYIYILISNVRNYFYGVINQTDYVLFIVQKGNSGRENDREIYTPECREESKGGLGDQPPR